MDHDEIPRPTTPLDDIYAALLREQPDNELLWERIVTRAKRHAEPLATPDDTPEGQARKADQLQRARAFGLLPEEPAHEA